MMSKITDLTKFRQNKLLLKRVQEQENQPPLNTKDNVTFILGKLRNIKPKLDPSLRRDLTAIEIIVEDIATDLALRSP